MMFESRMRSTRTGEETSVAAVWKELHQDLKSAAQKMLAEKKPEMEAAGVEDTAEAAAHVSRAHHADAWAGVSCHRMSHLGGLDSLLAILPIIRPPKANVRPI